MEQAFDFKHSELYAMCRLAWSLCQANIADFHVFSAVYTQAYINQMLAEVEAAEALPDDDARKEVPAAVREDLVSLRNSFIDKFGLLKRYILKAYPQNLVPLKLDAAGRTYEEGANKCNWESVSSLMTNAVAFVSNNSATLEANNNMPAGFWMDISVLAADFSAKLLDYQQKVGNAESETLTKLVANNNIFSHLKNLIGDAQAMYRRNELLKKKFSLANLKYITSGVDSAGIGGRITMPVTRKGIPQAKITIVEKERTVTTDETGRYEIRQLPEGKYTVLVEAEGFKTYTKVEQNVKVGTLSRLNVEMERG